MNVARPFVLARSVNATGSFPSRIPTLTEPVKDVGTATGQSAIKLSNGSGGLVPGKAVICFFGVGATNTTFDARVILWKKLPGSTQINAVWIPIIMAGVSLVLNDGTGPGPSGAPTPLAGASFADTVTLTSGTGEPFYTNTSADTTTVNGTVKRYSPANELIAWIEVKFEDGDWLELTFNIGTATSANALISLKDC